MRSQRGTMLGTCACGCQEDLSKCGDAYFPECYPSPGLYCTYKATISATNGDPDYDLLAGLVFTVQFTISGSNGIWTGRQNWQPAVGSGWGWVCTLSKGGADKYFGVSAHIVTAPSRYMFYDTSGGNSIGVFDCTWEGLYSLPGSQNLTVYLNGQTDTGYISKSAECTLVISG